MRISLTRLSDFKECDPSEEGTACWNVTTVIKYNPGEYDSDVVETSITEAIENGQTEGAYFSELDGFKSLPYRSTNVTSGSVSWDPTLLSENEAVAGYNETGAIIGLSSAVVVCALLASLMGFFAFRRRAEKRKDRVHDFSYESNEEADKDFFADDIALSPARCPTMVSSINSSPTDEEEGRDEAISIFSLQSRARSAATRASNKSGASRASSKSSMSVSDKSIMSQIRLSLWSPKDLATATVVSAKENDIEAFLDKRFKLDNKPSRESRKKMKVTTPSFEEENEEREFLPNDLVRKDTGLKSVTSTKSTKTIKSTNSTNTKTIKSTNSTKSTKTINSTNSSKRKAETVDFLTKPTKKEAGNLQEQNQTTSEEESPSLLKSTSSGLMSLVSWKKDTPREEKWAAVVDEASGKTYYYNEDTQETTWVKPEGFVDEPSKKNKVLVYSKQGRNRAQSSGGEWQVATDRFSGKVYYFNTLTLQTTWTKPKGFSDGDEGSDDSDGEVNTEDLGSLYSRKTTSCDK